jgi:hypothetical protein
MKCNACSSDQAFVRVERGWKKLLLRCLALVPLKCQHCYHKFSVPWLLTLGKVVTPPALRVAQGTHVIGPLRVPRPAAPPSTAPTHSQRRVA